MCASSCLRVEPVHDKDYAYGFYDEGYYLRILDNEHRPSHQLCLNWLERCLQPQPGETIVDLGCGAGLVSRYMASRGTIVHGVDLSETAVLTARAVNASFPSATFCQADASQCTHLANESFDKACSVDVIEHCGYDVMLGIFREAYRLIKPGGLYFVYTPNPLHWIERLKEWHIILKPHPTHTGLRPAGPIIRGLEMCGFELVEHRKPASIVPVVNWFERFWSCQPIFPQLAVYRIVLLARKPEGQS